MAHIDLQGRYRIEYNWERKTYILHLLWNDAQHRCTRTITEEEAETLQRILTGGWIPKEETKNG